MPGGKKPPGPQHTIASLRTPGDDDMTDKPLSEVYLGDGHGESFWDVSFTDLQIRHAEVKTEDMRSICVSVDPETGSMTLSEAYAPGSQEHSDEESLFVEFEDAIVREMVKDHRFSDQHAFLERAAESTFQRGEFLEALDVTLDDLRIDLEDDEDELDRAVVD